jgi:shikimate kinase
MNLILFGFKSSGKTYFGKLLAQSLGISFIDTDQKLEECYRAEFFEKLSCREISLKWGETFFRKRENCVIDSLCETFDAVIALGGGAVLHPDNCLKLKKLGKLVYLEIEKEVIKQRLLGQAVPSFLDPYSFDASFDQMYRERKPIYENLSQHRLKIGCRTDLEVLDELKTLIKIRVRNGDGEHFATNRMR